MNVKAINRTSENFAQYINKKEDERLAKKLTSIDREKTVFNNSITRDEKVGTKTLTTHSSNVGQN